MSSFVGFLPRLINMKATELERSKAEQAKAIAEAYATLLEAVANLNSKGGSLAVDPDNLAKILRFNDRSEEVGDVE